LGGGGVRGAIYIHEAGAGGGGYDGDTAGFGEGNLGPFLDGGGVFVVDEGFFLGGMLGFVWAVLGG